MYDYYEILGVYMDANDIQLNSGPIYIPKRKKLKGWQKK